MHMDQLLRSDLFEFFSFIIRMLVAAFCGAIVGLERQQEHKPAGARTLSLVSMGSALFMIISLAMTQNLMIDASRIPAQIVTGIGFLGAGAIIREKGSVRGLTTAAGVWIVSAIGMAIGMGMYLEGIFATFVSYLILGWLPKYLKK